MLTTTEQIKKWYGQTQELDRLVREKESVEQKLARLQREHDTLSTDLQKYGASTHATKRYVVSDQHVVRLTAGEPPVLETVQDIREPRPRSVAVPA